MTEDEIAPYLPTLMETMLSALNNAETLKIKELAVSAISAIGQWFASAVFTSYPIDFVRMLISMRNHIS